MAPLPGDQSTLGRTPRRPQARHARPVSRAKRVRKWAIVASCIALVLGGIGFAASLKLNNNIHRVDISSVLGNRPTRAAAASGGAEPLNIMVFGSDTRQGSGNSEYGKDTVEGGAHSDTNLLIHISADRSWAQVVSIPRDSMTPAPANCLDPTSKVKAGVVRQWNYNFHNGGPACAVRTLEGLSGIYVDHFMVIDFSGFQTMVDALGGVPVCLSQPLVDKQAHVSLPAGRQVLDGKQALGYVRARKSLGDGSDLGRIKRQQVFMSSIVQEATRTSLLLRPDKLFNFLNAATQSLTVDEDLGVSQMSDLASSLRNIGIGKVSFVTVPTQPYPADPNRVEWSPAAGKLWASLRDDVQLGKAKSTRSPSSTSGPATPSPSVSQRKADENICN